MGGKMIELGVYWKKDALALVPELAQLYIEGMREWPYYLKNVDGAEDTIRNVIQANYDSYFVITAEDKGKVVGACAAIYLPKTYTNIIEAYKQAGVQTDRALWIVQMTIQKEYRELGLSTRLVERREQLVRQTKMYRAIMFSARTVDMNDWRIPEGYFSLDRMWEKRGYRKVTQIEVRAPDSTDTKKVPELKTYDLWVKELN